MTRTDNDETGSIEVSLTVSRESVAEALADFYAVVAPRQGLDGDASWDDVDKAAEERLTPERYRELRRDFVVNKAASEALASLGIVPALTPRVHAPGHPSVQDDYAFELSVVERPSLSLSSYDPVEIETADVEVTGDLVDARIAELLEAHAEYAPAPARPVVPGDCVRVDIATMSGGKTVPRLTGKGMVLELSDGSMPQSFVDGLVGTDVGQTRVVDYVVRRPRAISDDDVDRYRATVAVLGQLEKTVPELSDDWVDAHIEAASSVAEFREGVASGLAAEVAHFNRDTHARLANIELEKRLVGTVPDAFYQASRAGLMDKLERQLAERGQTLDEYLEQERMNEEELSVQTFIKAAENLRQGFALEALFDGRGMSLAESDLAYACEQAFGKGSYDPEELKGTGKFRLVESAAKRMVALNWLADTAIVKG